MILGGVPARTNTAGGVDDARRDVSLSSGGARDDRLRHPEGHLVLAVPVLGRALSDTVAVCRNGIRQRLAARGLGGGTDIGRIYRRRFGICYVFSAFAAVALIGGIVTLLCAIETKRRVLEELSP